MTGIDTCACEACTLRRALNRCEEVTDHIAARLGFPIPPGKDSIMKAFDTTMDWYDRLQAEIAELQAEAVEYRRKIARLETWVEST